MLLGHGSGAYWAARYLSERKPANVHNLLMVAAELPAGFAPPLDEFCLLYTSITLDEEIAA